MRKAGRTLVLAATAAAGQQIGLHVADFVLHHLRSAPVGAR